MPTTASMPTFAGEHQRRVGIGDRQRDALLEDDASDFGFGLLPVGVQIGAASPAP